MITHKCETRAVFKEPQQRTRTSSATLRDLFRHNSKNWMILPGRPPSRYEASMASARAPGSILAAGGACVSPGHA